MAEHAYRAALGPSPFCTPGDHTTAMAFLAKLQPLLLPVHWDTWTPAEKDRLARLTRLWWLRATGRDLRFELRGTKSGPYTDDELDALHALKRHSSRTTLAPDLPRPAIPHLTQTSRQRRERFVRQGQHTAAHHWTPQQRRQRALREAQARDASA